ncbi:hypothetical protein WH43_00045 [Rheinheimera sp. KL1]|uniref:RHS repeat-associated core domain-containing protein n=1 Tax=Rheinheimera sp. KL1 TaxID=1635005 RepID=UPI0006A95194|nr:RHS repeat-associated core domain-containing protein [Rheinheimera sp. KL1]KOO60056.1 hypothetical protein WH43_00045 [Rheinheimera sp. KL1]
MNGRAYDYNLGRFLSVDPVIQSPGNSQSLNPYSYIMNNPLAGTDPTGYCAAATGTRIKSCGDMKVDLKIDGKMVGSTVVKDVNFKNGAEVSAAKASGAGQIGRAIMDIGAPKEVSGSGASSSTGNSTSNSSTANGGVADSIKGVAKAGLGSLKKGGLLGVGLTPMLTASDEEMDALAMPIMAANKAEHEEIQAAGLSRVRTTGGGIVLYHGTDVQSALRLLNGEPLSAQVASGNKIDGLPGFYLATDYDDAVFFAARRGEGAVIQFIISNKALGGLNANGAYFQKIPVGGFRADGYEYLVAPQAFGAFNTFRNGKEIVVTP